VKLQAAEQVPQSRVAVNVLVLAPALPQLHDKAPHIRIELNAATQVVSLARGDADLAVRLVKPVGNSLNIKALPSIRLGLFASERYLAGRDPQALALSRERLLGYDEESGASLEVRWAKRLGFDSLMALCTSSATALLAAARAGAGIAAEPMDPYGTMRSP